MSQLKSFAGYGKTAPYVPFAYPCALVNLDGYAAGVGWLQIHDKASAPTAAAVPLKSVNVAAAGPLASFLSVLGPITLANGLAIAMSSTEGTYTALATSFDAIGEVDEFEVPPPALTTVTLAGSDDAVDVWTEGAGGKNLYSLSVTNAEGAARYVHVHARVKANVVSGVTVPLLSVPTSIADGTTRKLSFGAGGYLVQEFSTALSASGVAPPGTLYQGCSVILSSTANVTTFGAGNLASTIVAKYF